jgi:hypothetical protein
MNAAQAAPGLNTFRSPSAGLSARLARAARSARVLVGMLMVGALAVTL